MSNMARTRPNFYTTEISLLLAIVFFINSTLMFFDHFLSSFSAMIAALASTTCCYIAFRSVAKPSESFESIYWSSFNLMSAQLTTSGDSTTWDLRRGFLSIGLGFTFLVLYSMFIWFWSCRSNQLRTSSNEQKQVPKMPCAPLPVEVSFVFIGNGIAMVERRFIPGGSIVWMFVGSAIMLSISVVCFCNYYFKASVSLGDQNQQLHTE